MKNTISYYISKNRHWCMVSLIKHVQDIVALKAKIANPTWGIYPGEMKCNISKTCINVNDSFICYSPKPMSHYSWMMNANMTIQRIIRNKQLFEEGNGENFITQIVLHSYRMERTYVTSLPGYKIPSWLINDHIFKEDQNYS